MSTRASPTIIRTCVSGSPMDARVEISVYASVMSNKNKCKWDKFKKKHTQKRRKKDEKLPEDIDYLNVQRITADVEGKCQKYSRIGPLTIVPFRYDALTLDNINKACKNPFGIASLMECDVLQSWPKLLTTLYGIACV